MFLIKEPNFDSYSSHSVWLQHLCLCSSPLKFSVPPWWPWLSLLPLSFGITMSFYRQSLYFSMGTMTDRTRECLTLFSCWPCKDFAFTTVQRSLKKNEAMHQLQVSCREENVCFSAASHCCCISRTDFTYKFHPLQSHYRPVNALSMIAPSHSLTSLSLPALELCMNR